ncbi:FAD-dependent monooxygenase [Kitasatospora sp. NBC_01250]|uniref:FAD-dependent monooxygenase n=1 Tax=Kitasatospora sp. NBC_01250 TaxID=2903571 RepID=UPI002E335B6C|nr:FAD-dependent monooxygenase [Kitasatospora sp. NBC_01250]
MDSEVSVVIAGGGLVGLSLALFLADQGVRTLLVEQHDGPSTLPRGRGLNLRTMEVLRAAGIEAALRGAPASVLRDLPEIARADTLAGDQLFHAARPALESFTALSPTTPLMCDQNDVEPVLREQAQLRGAELRFGTRLRSFRPDADGVTVQLCDRATGAEQVVRADYLVAADGHRSTVRAALGIGTSGTGSIAHYVNIPFRADLAGPLRGRRLALCYLNQPVPHTMLTRFDHPEHWVLMVPYRPESGERAEDFTPSRCLELIRAATGVPDLLPAPLALGTRTDPSAVTTVQTWELASWTADRYRTGRVLLAGDAAHVMAPAGGLGGNTGVQDAHNLAWKLAAVLRGTAQLSLLDSYEQERRPVALAACEQSVRQQLSRRSADSARPQGPVAHPLTAVLGYRYRSAAVAAEDGTATPPPPSLEFAGEPGSRAPHHRVLRGTEPLSTLDLYRGGFVLLCGSEGEHWAAAGRRLADRLGLRVYRIGDELHDESGDFASAHGITDRGAVLVRPDGFVGWRATDQAPEGTGRQTLDTVFARLLGWSESAGPWCQDPYQRPVSRVSATSEAL